MTVRPKPGKDTFKQKQENISRYQTGKKLTYVDKNITLVYKINKWKTSTVEKI